MQIYLDNASTTPMLPEVIQHMTEVMHESYGNPSSIHRHGRKAKSIIENARKIVAKVINASLGEVFFTSSATEANNMVIKNAVQDLGIQRIIPSGEPTTSILKKLSEQPESHPELFIPFFIKSGRQVKKKLVVVVLYRNGIGTSDVKTIMNNINCLSIGYQPMQLNSRNM